MQYSTAMIVAAMTIGEAVAGPAHAHLHRHAHAHEKKDVNWNTFDWQSMGIDWSSAWAAGQHSKTASTAVPIETKASAAGAVFAQTTTSAASTPTTSTPAASTSSTEDVVSDITSGSATLWNNLVGLANNLKAFGEAVANTGEVVSATGNYGNPQGSNMIKVDSASGYDFTNTYINSSPESITVVIWNKAYSKDGAPADANLGSCVAPETPTLTFALAPQGKQIVAFQDGTIIGWAQATSARSPSGAFATTWGEGKFWSSGSGFDMSAILNPNGNDYNMTITNGACNSSPTENYWIAKDNNPLTPVPVGNSDGSCYVPGSSAHLTTYMGGTM